MENATNGGTQMATSTPAVGKYNGKPLRKVAAGAMDENRVSWHYGFLVEMLSSVFAIQMGADQKREVESIKSHPPMIRRVIIALFAFASHFIAGVVFYG